MVNNKVCMFCTKRVRAIYTALARLRKAETPRLLPEQPLSNLKLDGNYQATCNSPGQVRREYSCCHSISTSYVAFCEDIKLDIKRNFDERYGKFFYEAIENFEASVSIGSSKNVLENILKTMVSLLSQNKRLLGISFSKSNTSNQLFHVHSQYWRSDNDSLNLLEFDQISDDTLESLTELFERLADDGLLPDDCDVQLASGVLTVAVGGQNGTYVINKQTPNRQIWLSSPTSGPKRYDFTDGRWLYSHDGISLHELLTEEISKIVGQEVNFTQLPFGSFSKGES